LCLAGSSWTLSDGCFSFPQLLSLILVAQEGPQGI
jgi:hypothetical protein